MYTYNLYTLHYTNCTTLIAPLQIHCTHHTNYPTATTTTTSTATTTLHYNYNYNHNHNYNYTTPPYTTTKTTTTTTTTLHPAAVGDVTTATTPKSTAPTTFRSISGFALPSMHDNSAPIVSYLWNFINFRHRLAQYYWSSGWIIMIHQVTIFPNGSGLLPWNAFTFCGVPWVQGAAP